MMLCGCSADEDYEQKFEDYRTELLQLGAVEMTADVETNYGDNVSNFKLLCTCSSEETTVEILEPEQISKVKANILDEETTLEFDGVVMETGSSITEGLSPMTAMPKLVDALYNGFVQSVWQEEKDEESFVVTELLLPDDTLATVWQSETNMIPKLATLQKDDEVAVKINIVQYN